MYKLCIVFTSLQQNGVLSYIINNQILDIQLTNYKLFYS